MGSTEVWVLFDPTSNTLLGFGDLDVIILRNFNDKNYGSRVFMHK